MIIRSHKNFGLMLSIFCILGLISCEEEEEEEEEAEEIL